MLPISGNGERTLTDSSNVQTKKSTVKRKFPGPAGILPDDEMELCNNVQFVKLYKHFNNYIF